MNLKCALTSGLVILATVTNAQDVTNQCNQKCSDNKKVEDQISSCQRGCRLYSIKYNAERSIFDSFFNYQDRGDLLGKCTDDCNQSYKDASAESCADGCRWMKETPRNVDVFNFGDGGMTITLGSLPRMDGVSNMFNQINNMVHQQIREQNDRLQRMLSYPVERQDNVTSEKELEKSGGGMFRNLLRTVHDHMSSVMKNFSSEKEHNADDDDDDKIIHGGGELVVVRSGPGFHEKKTYHLGPDADIEKILDTNMDDMLNHDNPMEKFLSKDQVEVFDPKDQNAEIKPANFFFDTDPWGLINKLGFGKSEEEVVNGPLEGPRLPETGLRSRHASEPTDNAKHDTEFGPHPFVVIDRSDVCRQKGSDMEWSVWFSCLHVKMGLPNWLLVSTVALGVIFTLWLCLVIPNNAPKQKVRTPKNVDTKEFDANSVATIVVSDEKKGALDLPPSYDDVTKNELEPVHDFRAKILLVDDDDIVEPLPDKVNLQDRNCSNV